MKSASQRAFSAPVGRAVPAGTGTHTSRTVAQMISSCRAIGRPSDVDVPAQALEQDRRQLGVACEQRGAAATVRDLVGVHRSRSNESSVDLVGHRDLHDDRAAVGCVGRRDVRGGSACECFADGDVPAALDLVDVSRAARATSVHRPPPCAARASGYGFGKVDRTRTGVDTTAARQPARDAQRGRGIGASPPPSSDVRASVRSVRTAWC